MDQYRRFDEAYYHRFYENPKTRIYGAKEHSHLAQYVFSFARWRDRRKYDLIICQGVLQYLSDPDVAPAVANIAAMAGGLVYFEVLTRGDLRERADVDLTDTDVFVRNGSYYRGLFAKHLLPVGGGLHWTRELTPPFWELDVAVSK